MKKKVLASLRSESELSNLVQVTMDGTKDSPLGTVLSEVRYELDKIKQWHVTPNGTAYPLGNDSRPHHEQLAFEVMGATLLVEYETASWVSKANWKMFNDELNAIQEGVAKGTNKANLDHSEPKAQQQPLSELKKLEKQGYVSKKDINKLILENKVDITK